MSSCKKSVELAMSHVVASCGATTARGMAQAVGVSQKTLETAFKSELDVTPGKFLVRFRLNQVRGELLLSDVNKTIAEIALRNGFTHPGRFRKAYRELFGELPSRTARFR